MVQAGEQLFKTDGNCWACHGEDATGARGVGANLTDDEWWHSDGSYEAIVRTIGTGVSSDKARNAFSAMMPARGGSRLTDEQLREVAAYVWSLRRKSDSEMMPGPGDPVSRYPGHPTLRLSSSVRGGDGRRGLHPHPPTLLGVTALDSLDP